MRGRAEAAVRPLDRQRQIAAKAGFARTAVLASGWTPGGVAKPTKRSSESDLDFGGPFRIHPGGLLHLLFMLMQVVPQRCPFVHRLQRRSPCCASSVHSLAHRRRLSARSSRVVRGRLAIRKHRPLQKEHDDGSTTDRPFQLAIAPLRESHVTAQELAQEFVRLDRVEVRRA